jgi:hypothetical protein
MILCYFSFSLSNPHFFQIQQSPFLPIYPRTLLSFHPIVPPPSSLSPFSRKYASCVGALRSLERPVQLNADQSKGRLKGLHSENRHHKKYLDFFFLSPPFLFFHILTKLFSTALSLKRFNFYSLFLSSLHFK